MYVQEDDTLVEVLTEFELGVILRRTPGGEIVAVALSKDLAADLAETELAEAFGG